MTKTTTTAYPVPARLTRAPFVTLLRHEWLRTRGFLGVSTGIAALVVVAATLIAVTGLPFVAFLSSVIAIVVAVVLVPALQLELAVDYWRSSYGRTGYFTQAVPIRGATLYWAKMSWAAIVTVVGLVVTIALGCVAWVGFASANGGETNPFVLIREFLAQATQVLSPWMIVAIAILYIGFYIIWPVQYYFAASVGSEAPANQLGAGGPILVFVGLYVVVQVLSLVGLFVIPLGIGVLGDGTVGLVPFDLISNVAAATQADDVVPIGFLPAFVIVAAVCLWRTARSWSRKVSLL